MHRRLLLGAIGSGSLTHNLELEGNLSFITTNAQLATFLGVSSSKIRTFTNTGSLIKANIRGNYPIPSNQFQNNTSLTKFRDVGGIIETVNANAIRATQITELLLPKVKTAYNISYNSLLENLILPELIIGGIQLIRNNTAAKQIILKKLESIPENSNYAAGLTSCELIDMRSLRIYGEPSIGYSATGSGLSNLKTGCEIRVHVALATANAGAVNESLRYAKNLRSSIVKFYDDNGNYVSTL